MNTRIEVWYDESDDGAWVVSRCEEDGTEIKMLSAFPLYSHDPEDEDGSSEALDRAYDRARSVAEDDEAVIVRRQDGTIRYA